MTLAWLAHDGDTALASAGGAAGGVVIVAAGLPWESAGFVLLTTGVPLILGRLLAGIGAAAEAEDDAHDAARAAGLAAAPAAEVRRVRRRAFARALTGRH